MMSAEESHRIISSTAEAELLVHCARLKIDQSRAERISALLDQELDWIRLHAPAQRNALMPFLYFHLSRIAPEKFCLNDSGNYANASKATVP